MLYNPKKHNRRSIRLKAYDYSQKGLYFITISCQKKECLFGIIKNDVMILNDAGQMVEKWYRELGNKFPDRIGREMVIMPNHFHCIIENMDLIQGTHTVDLIQGTHTGAPLHDPGTNVYVNPGTHVHGNPGTNAHGNPNTNAHGNSGINTHGNPGTHVHGNPGANVYGNPGTHVHGNPGTHVHGNPGTNAHGNPGTHVHGNPGTNAHGNPGTNAHGNSGTNVHGNPGTHVHGNPDTNVHGNPNTHVGAPLCGRPKNMKENKKFNASIGDIMDWFKTMTTNEYIRGVKNKNWKRFDGKLWQRNYWEHIIRNEESYYVLSEYIINNPKNWDKDKLFKS